MPPAPDADVHPPDRPAASPIDWHAIDADRALALLGSRRSGLTAAEAADRLAADGPNALPPARRRGPLRRFADQFRNVLIHVLLAAGTMAAAIGHATDALVIFGVVLANAAIGFFQESRAERAMEAIRALLDPQTSVVRDGRRTTVAAQTVVVGDLVLIEPGDRVPADLRLVRTRGLRIDEAALTGESVPAEKSSDRVDPAAGIADRTSIAHSGTLVAAGQGTGVVVATGARTELGRISTMIAGVEPLATPLVRQMDRFARQITAAVLALSAAVLAYAVATRHLAFGEAFMAVVGLAVAAIPEGLPAVMTIALAVGVRRMARRNAIVRQLPAVETLGSVSVVCSDKTGTLTRNEMSVRTVVTADGATLTVDGVGYAPDGAVRRGEAEAVPTATPALVALARAAALCNDAALHRGETGWTVDGDPMEGALLAFAAKAGQEPAACRARFARRDELPFDARHRVMATLHPDDADGAVVFLKGAPEHVIAICDGVAATGGVRALDPGEWHRAVDRLAAEGQRVLALACRRTEPDRQSIGADVLADGFRLLGIVGLIDPPRPEAVAAVAECRAAGIAVKMITGDHAATAMAIARQVGLSDDPVVLTGHELDGLDDAALRDRALGTTVFARASPEHKLRLVGALQVDGSVVAMTGDGVNDAPALRRADVGIAMGRKGTEAAKEASEIVLADDNFASIVAAVREGRTVYDNIAKVIAWTLPTNGGEALTIVLAVLFGLTLPVTPVQILWINMITAVALGLALAFEPTEPGTMRRPPRRPGAGILSRRLVWQISFVSVLMVAGTIAAWLWAEARALPVEAARTMAVNALVAMEIAYLYAVRRVPGGASRWRDALGTPAVMIGVGATIAAQAAFTYLPAMQRVFGSTPLGLPEIAVCAAVAVLLLAAVEGERRLGRGRR